MCISRMNLNNTNVSPSGYQLEANEKSTVDFTKDLKMMDLLISEYTTNDDGSMDNTFGRLLPVQKEYMDREWKTLDDYQNVKDVANSSVKNHGAHLLLLLAYIMLTTVLDDESNNIQM